MFIFVTHNIKLISVDLVKIRFFSLQVNNYLLGKLIDIVIIEKTDRKYMYMPSLYRVVISCYKISYTLSVNNGEQTYISGLQLHSEHRCALVLCQPNVSSTAHKKPHCMHNEPWWVMYHICMNKLDINMRKYKQIDLSIFPAGAKVVTYRRNCDMQRIETQSVWAKAALGAYRASFVIYKTLVHADLIRKNKHTMKTYTRRHTEQHRIIIGM